MTSFTNANHHESTSFRRMREAMGPGYQVAIFREASPLAPIRPRNGR